MRLKPFLGIVAGLLVELAVGLPAEAGGSAGELRSDFPPFSVSGPAAGVDGLPKSLGKHAGIEDCITYARFHNSGLHSAFAAWRAALARIPQAESLPDPVFTYSYYVREVETRVGPQRWKVGLSQKIPWFGKLRLRGAMATQAARAAWEALRALDREVVYRVKAAWLEYYYLKRSIEVTRENFQLLEALEQVARERYRSGGSLRPVLQVQVELGKFEDRLRSLAALRPALVARLNAALGRPARFPIPWPEKLPEVRVRTPQPAEIEAVVQNHPRLARLAALAARQDSAAALARKSGRPDITVALDRIDTGPARMPGTADSGKDPIMIGVRLNLPIWRNRYTAEVRETAARLHAIQDQRRDLARTLVADAHLALYRFRDAERKINLYGETLIPKAKQSLAVARQGFQAGKSSFLDLLDGERSLLELELALEKAKVDRVREAAKLEEILGRLPPHP